MGAFNTLDFLVVVGNIFEVVFELSANLTYLRIFRVFRLVRFVRVVRTVRALRSLRTMVFAIIHTFTDLMWSLALIFFLVFVFAIIFTSAAESHFQSVDPTSEEAVDDASTVRMYFGGIYISMVTLLSAITGGEDWMIYGRALRLLQHGEMYFQLLCFYICICVVGMLNVVTGIFVDNAVSTRTQDEVVDRYQEDNKSIADELKRVFRIADKDGNGLLSLAELDKQLRDPWVRAYFAGLDIDPGEAKIIFALLDSDKSGMLTTDEFINGVIKTKGSAKNIDILSLMYDSSLISTQLATLCSYVEETLGMQSPSKRQNVTEQQTQKKEMKKARPTMTSMRTMGSLQFP